MALYLLSLIIGLQQSCHNLSKPDLQCMYSSDLSLITHCLLFHQSSPFHSYLHLHRSDTIHQKWMAWWIIGSTNFYQLGLFDLFDTMDNTHNKDLTSIFPPTTFSPFHPLTKPPSHLFILSRHSSTHQTNIPRPDTIRNNVCRRCCCRPA